jgi:hypothetical protein
MKTIEKIWKNSTHRARRLSLLIIIMTIVPVLTTLICVGFYNVLPQVTWSKLILLLSGVLFTLVSWLLILLLSNRTAINMQQDLDYYSKTPLNVIALHKAASNTGTYGASLLAMANIFPIFASILSIIIFVMFANLPSSTFIATLGSTVFSLIAWLLLAIPYKRLTAADRANTSSYELLVNRLHQLGMWIDILDAEKEPEVECERKIRNIGLKEIHTSYEAINQNLGTKSLSWMMAVGYVNTWKLMHRADEALIFAEPDTAVINDALHDEMSLKDSALKNREDLLIKLRKAIKTFDQHAATYLIQQPPEEDKKMASSTQVEDQPGAGNQSCKSADEIKIQAKTIIREVRFTLHQFRDDRWEKLVRVRNHLMRMTILTGLVLYVLIEFVIITIKKTEIGVPMLEAATIFFFVGAIVGLFGRLYNQSKTDTSIDDFRLAATRLMTAPLYSGLAALGGVLVVQKSVLGSSNVFALDLTNILIAAIFGLTPGLFSNAIQKEADQYKSDLSSTGAPKGEKRNVPFPEY